MIKILTGELEPQDGMVWKHPNLRVAYVAQHAFHHIEQVRKQLALKCFVKAAVCPVSSSDCGFAPAAEAVCFASLSVKMGLKRWN